MTRQNVARLQSTTHSDSFTVRNSLPIYTGILGYGGVCPPCTWSLCVVQIYFRSIHAIHSSSYPAAAVISYLYTSTRPQPCSLTKVYRKRCPTGLVWLGGNSARGCKGAKRGYFVFVHVANPAVEPALSPALPGQSFRAHGSNSVVGEQADRDVWTANEAGRTRCRSRRSLSTSSRVSSGVSDSVYGFGGSVTGGGGGDDDSVASAPSSPGRPLASIRHSSGSRSWQSLDAAVGDEAGDGIGWGRVHVATRECRSMSTTIPATTMGRDSVGARTRAWTGGEGTLWMEGFREGGGTFDRSIGIGDGRGNIGGSDEAPNGLQRISALWDTEKDGPLSQMPVPFDRTGRRWSRKFNVDAANTAGPLETSGATLGVSVSALTGQFHRTRVVTLYPRLIVRNFLGIPLEVRARRGGVGWARWSHGHGLVSSICRPTRVVSLNFCCR